MNSQSASYKEEKTQTRDGWTLGYRTFKAQKAQAILLFFPAMGASTRSLIPMAEALVRRGVTVILADPRGIGMSLPRPSRSVDFGMYDRIDHDWPAFIEAGRALEPGLPLYIGGHSLGGQLSALYAAQNPGKIDGLITIAACALSYKHWSWPARPVIYLIYCFFGLLARIFGYLPGQHVGWGRPCGGTLTREWSIWGRKGLYTKRDGSSAEDSFANYRGRALIMSFEDDLRYAPKAAVDALADRFVNAKISRWHKTPKELDRKDVGHFLWRKTPAVWHLVGDWIIADRAKFEDNDHVAAGESQ
jgi:predicted alpha/beta hydrolase